jgi:hypothetical protein
MRMIADEKRRREEARPDLLTSGPSDVLGWSPWLWLGAAFPVWLPLLLLACCS